MTPDIYLSKDGESIVAKRNGLETLRVPSINIEGIVCFNYMGVSPYLMKLCAEKNIGLCFVSPNGNFLARVIGKTNGNVLLRREQYRIADDEKRSLNLSKIFIAGKIYNSRKVLERFKRDHVKSEIKQNELNLISNKLNIEKEDALHCKNNGNLRGIEGIAANLYFSQFGDIIVSQKNDFKFNGRNKRPPKDEVNAMLSYTYTLLAHEVQSSLETVGLDPYVGFLHTDRPGRASLALDMMEEFRSYLADRLVLSLINKKQVSKNGFIDNGAENIIMKDETKKTILSSWQKRKKESIIHPFLKENVPIGLLPYIQSLLLARYIRGDIDNYPVFLIQ